MTGLDEIHSRQHIPSSPSSSPAHLSHLKRKSFFARFIRTRKTDVVLPPASVNASSTKSDSFELPPKIEDWADSHIFGQPLASAVKTSPGTVNHVIKNGMVISYGPIPSIVSVCGEFLEQNALQTQGIFRINGSVKRSRELQKIFAEPPTYGQNMDWTGYTVHDAASVLRRYLNSLPEPIIPLQLYDAFRAPFKDSANQKISSDKENALVATLFSLLNLLEPANRQLLLYLLDLLELFAKNDKKNLMPPANLAAMFQPSILSHPDHNTLPDEYQTSQNTIMFLVSH
ncbi:Rho GTPase activation protein, partial [Lipomyces arxii]|uniref:Rho GTPase activation protein n=1 Tax=Lipomyces arxii TaxID=56418 RepID=UPI0034CD837B